MASQILMKSNKNTNKLYYTGHNGLCTFTPLQISIMRRNLLYGDASKQVITSIKYLSSYLWLFFSRYSFNVLVYYRFDIKYKFFEVTSCRYKYNAVE
ncbi:hypothetical protein QTP88_012498 [Uroleucon formosanum]